MRKSIKKEINGLGFEIILTKKDTQKGEIKHGVVMHDLTTGRFTKIKTFYGIKGAFDLYKKMVALNA